MRFLAELLGAIFPEYQYTWLFPDFEESISLELGEHQQESMRLRWEIFGRGTVEGGSCRGPWVVAEGNSELLTIQGR